MPTATERGQTRRRLLAAAALGCLVVASHDAARAAPLGRSFAAAWDEPDGTHRIGVLQWPVEDGAVLRVVHALEVPTRAHAVIVGADGELIAVARRPGAWLLRWRPGAPAASACWRWSEPDRSFNGHVVVDGPHALMSTETDAAYGAGLLVRRDARTLDVMDEWPTLGTDPHAVLPLIEGGWLVANGGIPTRPESGRVKTGLERMDASLVRLDSRGRAVGQWRVADRRLSLRHLARWGAGPVGVALQAEHDEPQARHDAPLLALWDGAALRLVPAAPLAGYAGDIAALPNGFLLSATRAGCIARFNADGRLIEQHVLNNACALATSAEAASGGWWAAGRSGVISGTDTITRPSGAALPALQIDNHWARV